MKKEIESLEKILKSNTDETILDSNILVTNDGKAGILEVLFEFHENSDLDIGFLTQVRDETIEVNRLLNECPHIYTIKEIIGEKQRFLEKFNGMYRWHKKKAGYRMSDEINLMRDISNEVFEMITSLKGKEFRTNSALYESILECIRMISESYDNVTEVKPRSYLYERKNGKQDYGLKTDEKIIATTFYRALKEKKPFNIISNDEAMTNKFRLSYQLLSCNDLENGLKELKDTTIQFFSIIPWQKEYYLNLCTKTIKEQDGFEFPGLGKEDTDSLKYSMDNLIYYGKKEETERNL